jgi:Icc-related predicted phosphoesterase
MADLLCHFAADLHGALERYDRLFAAAAAERPVALLLGGDRLPGLRGGGDAAPADGGFLHAALAPRLARLRAATAPEPTAVLAILGNDDPRSEEEAMRDLERRGLLTYLHGTRRRIREHDFFGYGCVPPTPFLLKDWERYDVSRHLDPADVSPEEGWRTVEVPPGETRWGTIARDLDELAGDADLGRAIFLFHAPPYGTALDRAALDGRMVDHAPLDPHVGSIAIRRFLESRQPLAALSGHIHESARLTGAWSARLGRTVCLSAAHDGPELALVRFPLDAPGEARRELL